MAKRISRRKLLKGAGVAGAGRLLAPGLVFAGVALLKYARAYQHLSHPAPGRGSTGVHELGFRKFDPVTLSLNEVQIPTITVVDDTFESHREVMAAIISRAKRRAGVRS